MKQGLSNFRLSRRSFTLFSQRQKSNMQAEWFDKMPDFVRRLEEALYRTATSKVRWEQPYHLSPPFSAPPGPQIVVISVNLMNARTVRCESATAPASSDL